MFMTGPQSRHQRRCVRDHNVYDRPAIWHRRRRARDATDFYECMMIHCRIESPSVLIQGMHMKVLVRYIGTACIFCRIESPSVPNTGYAYESFSKVYWDRVYFFCAPSGLWQGQSFRPPAAPPPPVQMKVECPPPPGLSCYMSPFFLHYDTQLDFKHSRSKLFRGGARLLRPLWIRHWDACTLSKKKIKGSWNIRMT